MTEQRPVILVADDDRLSLAVIQDLLGGWLHVLTAQDGAAALSLLEHQEVNAVLCDHLMPKVSGVEVLERCLTVQPRAARILVTASEDTRDIRDAINIAHVHRVILKPIRPAEIEAAVRGAMRECQLEQENERLILELQQALAAVTRHELELEHEVRVRTAELKEITDRLRKAGA